MDALYKLVAAGVRVPKPFGYFNDMLIMELVADAAGDPAPRLGEVDLTPETAREYHAFLIRRSCACCASGSSTAICRSSTCWSRPTAR